VRKAGKMLANIERQYSIELFYCHHRAVANIGAFIATILQGSRSTGDGRIFLKISASHSLMSTFRFISNLLLHKRKGNILNVCILIDMKPDIVT
jgi:hypothetical protein